jgi:hypothetical protein
MYCRFHRATARAHTLRRGPSVHSALPRGGPVVPAVRPGRCPNAHVSSLRFLAAVECLPVGEEGVAEGVGGSGSLVAGDYGVAAVLHGIAAVAGAAGGAAA